VGAVMGGGARGKGQHYRMLQVTGIGVVSLAQDAAVGLARLQRGGGGRSVLQRVKRSATVIGLHDWTVPGRFLEGSWKEVQAHAAPATVHSHHSFARA
jgi:hypothetical protein